ncbi:MAG: OsmC family protein [Ilumatobacter sp.]|nr:OsmC family protein [Ilumatobacter sp.]
MARALEVRDIPVPRENLQAAVEGDIEAVDKVLRITRIRVRYRIRIPAGMREKAQRAVDTHPTKCPAANSIRGCIDLDISAEITEA